MGRSFWSIFGVAEPFFGVAKLPLEKPNLPPQRAKVALGCKIQHVGDPLNTLVEASFETTAKTKGPHHQLLNLGFLHQLGDPRVLEQREEVIFERGHRSECG